MKRKNSNYPDVSDILARKASGRKMLANLSFAQKLDLLDRLRNRAAPIIAARKIRTRIDRVAV